LRRGAASLDGQDLRLDASCLCFGAGVELGLGRVGRNLATRPDPDCREIENVNRG